eukprot:g5387.t1
MPRKKFKVVLLGEGRVGKSSIVVRYVRGNYDDKMQSTIQASFLTKRINIGEPVTLNIWDTAGQERFHALGPIYYRDADGALLVYDITFQASFTRVKHWVTELKKMNRSIPIAIAANKSDLEKSRTVDRGAAEAYAQSIGAVHIHTSAKLNKGLDQVFVKLTQKMVSQSKSQASSASRASRRNKPLIIMDDGDDEKPSGGCC